MEPQRDVCCSGYSVREEEGKMTSTNTSQCCIIVGSLWILSQTKGVARGSRTSRLCISLEL